jgi:phage tail sheath gpL-like
MAQSKPVVTVNLLNAQTPSTPDEHKILVVGQKVGGTATSGIVVEGLLSEADANAAFGRTSQIAKALRALFKNLDISRIRPQVAAIGLDDNGSGVDATGSFAITGTATEAGTLTFYVDSEDNGKYEIAVASGDTATTIGDALEAAITANLDSPVTALNTTGTVALTAVNAGTQGNTIGLKLDGTVAGVSVAFTGGLTGGATDPVLTALFDSVVDKRFNTIVYPAEWGTSTLTDFTEPRFNVDDDVLDGLGIVSVTDTYANHNTAVDALNFRTLGYVTNNLVADDGSHHGGAIFENPIVIAAQIAAYRGLRLTVNANTSSIVVNGQAQGGFFFGGIPYHNTPFVNLPVIGSGNDFTNAQSVELENSGAWLLRNNPANTVLICNEAVTTYKTDGLGNPDVTYKYVNFLDTLSLVREYVFNNLKADFAQHILTTGDLVAGRPMVNKEGFIGTMMGYYATLSGINGDNSYVLLRAGAEEREAFREALENSVLITLSTGTITAEAIANIVSQVRNIIVNFTPTFE